MKKLYFLIGFCLLHFASFATVVTVNAAGAAGSYTTGYTQATTGRTDGNMVIASSTTATPRRGYAVFDLSGLVPAGATVTAVSIRFNFTTSAGGTGVMCGIRGFVGDLSTVTTPATLWADCSPATPAAFNTTNWGASTTGAQDNLPFNATGITFIQTNLGVKVSIGFATTSGTNIYTITGEGGTALTQPQLQITYNCTGVTGVAATATPNPVCSGSTLTLHAGGTGTTTYLWSGPSSFSSTLMNPTLTGGPGVTGIYTLTAYNAAGCGTTVSSPAVTLSAAVPGITGTTTVCAGGATTPLSDASAGGTWSSVPSSVANVGPSSGIVTGGTAGTATITYVTTAGCNTTAVVTVNPLPPAISGSSSVCVGSTTTLSDAAGSGTWSSSNTLRATVDGSGDVSGLSGGSTIISYTSGGCSATLPMAVNTTPAPIAGGTSGCPGTTVTLTDAGGGGVWTSSVPGVATIGSSSGVVSGVAPGATVITFSNGCGPNATTSFVVNPLPAAITGLTAVCLAATTTLSDSSPFGTWSSTPTSTATVGSTTGVVTGAALGVATIKYTLPTTCSITITVTVNAPPSVISGANSLCTGLTTTLTDAAPGGVWSSSNTALAAIGSTGIVTGVSFGIATITYTAGAGCFLVHTMTINPLAAIAGRDSVCQGLSTFLTNIVGGGHWSSSAPGTATVDIDSGRVSGSAPGSTIITYLLPTGCQSSVSFKVIAFPNAITGTTQACPGTTTSLSEITTGGIWSANNNSIATVGSLSGVVTGISADTVTIFFTIQPGCAANKLVTINPLPAPITGNIIVCPGTKDSLQDITPGGLWASSTPSLATVVDTSGVVSAIAHGSPVIEYILPTGCLRKKTLSILPKPVPNVVYDFQDNTFYADTIPRYPSYQWYDSIQGEITGATSPTVAALYTEYYFVVVTDSNGCVGASAPIWYNVSQLGTGNTTANKSIKIYPNPTSGSLYIESPVRVRAVISSMDGKVQMDEQDAKQINVSQLADAMYLITLYGDDGKALSTQKLIKQ